MLSDEIERIAKHKDLSEELKRLLLEDHLKRQSEALAKPTPTSQRLLSNGPLLAVIASIAAALVSGVFAYSSKRTEGSAEQILERQKFEYELVKAALTEHRLPDERQATLEFFNSIGLFQLLRIENTNVDNLPAILVTSESLFTVERLYPETAATIGLLLDERTISANSKYWKKFWHLYKVDLIGVESRAVAKAMIAFGDELKILAEQDAPPSSTLKRLGVEVVKTMADEVPALLPVLDKMPK